MILSYCCLFDGFFVGKFFGANVQKSYYSRTNIHRSLCSHFSHSWHFPDLWVGCVHCFSTLKTTGGLERSFFNGTHTYKVCLTVSNRDAMCVVFFFFRFFPLPLVCICCACTCVSVSVAALVLLCAAGTHTHTPTSGPWDRQTIKQVSMG